MDLKDLRSTDRFVADERLSGNFGAASITIVDLGDQGAQIEHAQPLRLGSKGRFHFKGSDVAVSAQALVVWSHLSKRPNVDGKLLYRSGLRIEEEIEDFGDALRKLVRGGVLHRDVGALDRKRKRLAEKEQEKWGKPVMKVLGSIEVPPDEALLIQHARERLRLHPDEALKWYNRAKYALADDKIDAIHYREDVLAVWEYLERSVDLSTIVKVFEKK